VRRTVPPSAEIEEQIDRLLAVGVGENPRESLLELRLTTTGNLGRGEFTAAQGRDPRAAPALSRLVRSDRRRSDPR
jgi:hypothetical protein